MEGGQTTHYLALGHKNLYEKTGTVATKHVFAGTQRIAEVRNGQVFYLHNDHLGSARAMSDSSGHVLVFTHTRPFGQPYPAVYTSEPSDPTDPGDPGVDPVEPGDPHESMSMGLMGATPGGTDQPSPTDYLFTGKELDDTGLYYFAARYYDPSVGRFVTEDIWQGRMADPATQNRYVYVTNNPLRYVDPTGHMPNLVAELEINCVSGFSSGEAVHWAKAISAFMASAYVSAVEKTAQVGRVVSDITGPIVNWARQGADKVGNSSGNSGNSTSPDPLDPKDKHHIATDKSKAFDFTKHPAIEKTGLNLSTDLDNIVELSRSIHTGRHTNVYHQEVWRRLQEVYDVYKGSTLLEQAVRAELRAIAQELLSGTLTVR